MIVFGCSVANDAVCGAGAGVKREHLVAVLACDALRVIGFFLVESCYAWCAGIVGVVGAASLSIFPGRA